MSPKRPVVLAVVSDPHCGSKIGVAPPQGVEDGEGGRWIPGDVGLWLWDSWISGWDRVDEIRRQEKANLWLLANGDLVDGFHHVNAAHQLITTNEADHAYIATETFRVPKALKPKHVFVTRGTEVHVGPQGASEEGIAKFLHAERQSHKWTAWRWRFKIHGKLFDAQHHPGTHGKMIHTRKAGVMRLAKMIWDEHKLAQDEAVTQGLDPAPYRHPDIAIRSHYHVFDDSGKYGYPTRAVITPAFQLATSYVRKVSPESISDIGLLVFIVYPNGRIHLEPILFKPGLPEVWTA